MPSYVLSIVTTNTSQRDTYVPDLKELRSLAEEHLCEQTGKQGRHTHGHTPCGFTSDLDRSPYSMGRDRAQEESGRFLPRGRAGRGRQGWGQSRGGGGCSGVLGDEQVLVRPPVLWGRCGDRTQRRGSHPRNTQHVDWGAAGCNARLLGLGGEMGGGAQVGRTPGHRRAAAPPPTRMNPGAEPGVSLQIWAQVTGGLLLAPHPVSSDGWRCQPPPSTTGLQSPGPLHTLPMYFSLSSSSCVRNIIPISQMGKLRQRKFKDIVQIPEWLNAELDLNPGSGAQEPTSLTSVDAAKEQTARA